MSSLNVSKKPLGSAQYSIKNSSMYEEELAKFQLDWNNPASQVSAEVFSADISRPSQYLPDDSLMPSPMSSTNRCLIRSRWLVLVMPLALNWSLYQASASVSELPTALDMAMAASLPFCCMIRAAAKQKA